MNQNPGMQAVTAQNAISEERTTRTVIYPITGDVEIDFISGIAALFASMWDHPGRASMNPTTDGFDMAVRVCEYMGKRWKEASAVRDKQDALAKQFSQMAQAAAPRPRRPLTPTSPPLDDYSTVKTPWPSDITTAGGTAELDELRRARIESMLRAEKAAELIPQLPGPAPAPSTQEINQFLHDVKCPG